MITLLACLTLQDEFTPEQRKALVHLAQIRVAIHLFKEFNDDYPRQLAHLVTRPKDAKVWPEGGFLLGPLPKDPWGNDYEYDPRGDLPKLWTWGADGKPGGEGAARDLNLENVFERRSAKQKTMVILEQVAQALDLYKLDTAVYPKSLRDLSGRYYVGELVDGWGHELGYRMPGSDRPYDLYSLGADGREGGEGDDEDLWHGGKPAKKPASKEPPFKVDYWAGWNAFEVGAEVELEMDAGGSKLTIQKTLAKKTADEITVKNVTKMKIGDQEYESPYDEPVRKPATFDAACPMCGKKSVEHEALGKWSQDRIKVGDQEIDCWVFETGDKDCKGNKITYKTKVWYSNEVPGQTVRLETESTKMWVTRFKK